MENIPSHLKVSFLKCGQGFFFIGPSIWVFFRRAAMFFQKKQIYFGMWDDLRLGRFGSVY